MTIEIRCQIAAQLTVKELPTIPNPSSGFIDQHGNFYPVRFCGHEDFNDIMQGYLTEERYTHFYQKWIKVSCTGPSFYVGQHSARINSGLIPTAKQKLAIQKYINKHASLKDGEGAIVHGFGDVVRDGNQLKFVKWND